MMHEFDGQSSQNTYLIHAQRVRLSTSNSYMEGCTMLFLSTLGIGLIPGLTV
jgi:hypothetical protein